MEINKYIDHTVLKATTTPKDIEKLCNEAKEYKFCLLYTSDAADE